MKKNDGFTLLEAIVAIAALLIMSVFILRMFLSSSTLNNRAKNTDMAVATAITAIESLKKHDSLSAYLAANDGVPAEDGSVTLMNFYDKDWHSLPATTASLPDNAVFRVQVDITADESPVSVTGTAVGTLYHVKVEIKDLSSQGENTILASFSTKKYFPIATGERRPS